MGVFTAAEITYLQSQRIGRLAKSVRITSLTWCLSAFVTIRTKMLFEIGGIGGFSKRKKYRDVAQNPRAAFVVDDVLSMNPGTVRGIEIRGRAEILKTGGTLFGPGFDPEMFRIRPNRVISWGIDTHMFSADARSVA